MPRKSTPRMGRSASRAMASTWASISQVARLRENPMPPVAQKAQAMAQPTCELMHTVYLAVGRATRPSASPRRRFSLRARASAGSGSGMRTASICAPSGSRNRYLTKPSSARRRSTMSRSGYLASRASTLRTSAGSCSKSSRLVAHWACTRANTLRATRSPTPYTASAWRIAGQSRSRKISGLAKTQSHDKRSRPWPWP